MKKIGFRKYWFGIVFPRAARDVWEYVREHVAMALLIILFAVATSILSANGILAKAVSEGYISDASNLIRTVVALLILSLFYLCWSVFYYPVIIHNEQEREKENQRKQIEEKQKTIADIKERFSNKKIRIYDDGDSRVLKNDSDTELRFTIYNDSLFPMENWNALIEEVKYNKKGDQNQIETDFPKKRFHLAWIGKPGIEYRTKPVSPQDYAQIAIAETNTTLNMFKITTIEHNEVFFRETGYYLITIKIVGTFDGVGVNKRIQVSVLYKGKNRIEKIPSHTDLS